MSQQTKSVLFNTSAGTDVQYVGENILIPGLSPIKQTRVVDFSQVNYRAEVSQVVTVGGVIAYTPTGSTKYTVVIADARRRNHGLTESPFTYSYVTPADVTAIGSTPALQRDAISNALIKKINAVSYNYTVAAIITAGAGTGFTITDKPGYYPIPVQGMTNREGVSTIYLKPDSDGRGFSGTNIALTTAAVISSGVGANLVTSAPVFDLVYTNLVSGFVDGPKTIAGATAISGQQYTLFSVTYLENVNLPSIANTYFGLLPKTVQIWIDNGAGASAVNLANYILVERSIHRGIAYRFVSNPTAQVDFLDNVILFQGPAGAVPATTGESKMVSDAKWAYTNIGTNVVVAPTPSNTGLIIDQTLVAGNGAEYTPSLSTFSPKEFVVGKLECSVLARVSAVTMANCTWLVGFRVKGPYVANFAYNGIGAIGSTAAAPTNISTQGSLLGTVVSTTSTAVLANAASYEVIVTVDINGVVTCKIADVVYPVYSVGTTPLVLPAGMIIIPFFRGVNVGGSAALLTVSEVVALPTKNAFA